MLKGPSDRARVVESSGRAQSEGPSCVGGQKLSSPVVGPDLFRAQVVASNARAQSQSLGPSCRVQVMSPSYQVFKKLKSSCQVQAVESKVSSVLKGKSLAVESK